MHRPSDAISAAAVAQRSGSRDVIATVAPARSSPSVIHAAESWRSGHECLALQAEQFRAHYAPGRKSRLTLLS